MKKMKWIVCLMLLGCLLTGCKRLTGDTAGYQVYYTNTEGSKLVTAVYMAKSSEPMEILGELFAQMETPAVAEDRRSLLPEGVEITDYNLTDGQLTLTFNDAYYQMDNISEVLLRAGLVMMTTQVPDVRTVVFHIGEAGLLDYTGEPVGAMTSSMFINNPVGINSYQYALLTLYFADESGEKLVREMRNVHYSSNTTLEKVVMEQLMKGPMNERLSAVLPEDVKILDISVEKKTCTVNLSESFLNAPGNDAVKPEVTIFAIVNSLCDVLDVERVQFQVEGSSDVLYRDELSFSGPFHRNSELLETSSQADDVPDEIAEPSIGL